MKKTSIILAFFMTGFLQAGGSKEYLVWAGIYTANLGLVKLQTGTVDSGDIAAAVASVMLATSSPKTKTELKAQMAAQVAVSGFMLGRAWYKMAHRPAPMPAARPRRLIAEVEELYDGNKVRYPGNYDER